jgi:hypothetical protein
MDAMERLTAYLCSRPGSESLDGFHQNFAEQILRQHAHELAEKIRNAPFEPSLLQRHQRRRAASLIDSES